MSCGPVALDVDSERPDYAYLKEVFRHLRAEVGIEVTRAPKKLPYVGARPSKPGRGNGYTRLAGLCEGSAADSVRGIEQDLLERPRQVGVPLPGRCLGAGHRDAGTGQHRGGAARGGWARNGIPAGVAVANLIAAPRGRSVDPVRRRPQGE